MTAYPTPGQGGTPIFVFFKMIAKDVKEITYIYRSVSLAFWMAQPGKKRKGGCTSPLLVRRGLLFLWLVHSKADPPRTSLFQEWKLNTQLSRTIVNKYTLIFISEYGKIHKIAHDLFV